LSLHDASSPLRKKAQGEKGEKWKAEQEELAKEMKRKAEEEELMKKIKWQFPLFFSGVYCLGGLL